MKEYLQLLAQRESRVVLGKNWANLWMLVVVLVATFISIAFSNGSMNYLEDKMSDPFTNWVNIPKPDSKGLEELRSILSDDATAAHYGYKSVQADCNFYFTFLGKEETGKPRAIRFLNCRFFEQMNSDLMEAILSEDNVIGNCFVPVDQLKSESLGIIITLDNLLKLDYSEDNLPSYLDYLSSSKGADTLGFEMIEQKYVAAPMPILAVVRRLPQNMDIVASNYWYSQYNNTSTHPFEFVHEDYQRTLIYYVREDVPDFKEKVLALMPDSLQSPGILPYEDYALMESWAKGSYWQVYPDKYRNDISLNQYVDLSKKIASIYPTNQVKRVFDYHCSDNTLPEVAFLSVSFASLDSIRPFETFVKTKGIQIEMSQVNSKENFNAVRVLAAILSWAMIVFSIVCIILFIVNMLQGYFQKVKRNLGTFKAFGLSTYELIETYMLILLVIVVCAITVSLAVTSFVQYSMHFVGILREERFDYLSLWSSSTVWIAIAIILASTVATVYVVMNRLLKQTPGDLIYER